MDFPLPHSLPPGTAEHVNLEGFTSAFSTFSANVQRRIFKLERLQSYVESDDESWREFQSGNIQRSLKLMPTLRAAEARYDIEFFRRGLQFLRMRAVELPLSPYLNWEFQSYIISAQYGETILVADVTNSDRNGALWNATDFLLFDSFAVLVHDYDSDGCLHGGWVCQDQASVKHYADLASQYTSVSVPLAVFMANHPSQI
jgi:hypothetical protein